jgi:hypothetical protein
MALYMFSQLDILPQAFPATKVHLEQLVAKAEVTTNAPTCG